MSNLFVVSCLLFVVSCLWLWLLEEYPPHHGGSPAGSCPPQEGPKTSGQATPLPLQPGKKRGPRPHSVLRSDRLSPGTAGRLWLCATPAACSGCGARAARCTAFVCRWPSSDHKRHLPPLAVARKQHDPEHPILITINIRKPILIFRKNQYLILIFRGSKINIFLKVFEDKNQYWKSIFFVKFFIIFGVPLHNQDLQPTHPSPSIFSIAVACIQGFPFLQRVVLPVLLWKTLKAWAIFSKGYSCLFSKGWPDLFPKGFMLPCRNLAWSEQDEVKWNTWAKLWCWAWWMPHHVCSCGPFLQWLPQSLQIWSTNEIWGSCGMPPSTGEWSCGACTLYCTAFGFALWPSCAGWCTLDRSYCKRLIVSSNSASVKNVLAPSHRHWSCTTDSMIARVGAIIASFCQCWNFFMAGATQLG